jgi:glucose-6-phosphate isomerase
MSDRYNWGGGFTLDFSLADGMSARAAAPPTARRLSQMRGMYADAAALERMVAECGDPVVYEFYELGMPASPAGIAFGTSITHPGKVGAEYFMTKGHFHAIIELAEVYYTLSGEGFMLTESPEGDVGLHPLKPGEAVYIPGRYAHRSINSGDVPLVTFYSYRADAGHDYGTIEAKGFRNLVISGRDGAPQMIVNPNWLDGNGADEA